MLISGGGGSDARPELRCLMLLYPNREEEEVACERAWAKWVIIVIIISADYYHEYYYYDYYN